MMSLTIRKIIVLGLIGIIFLMANILVVANWIADSGIAERAGWLRKEFLIEIGAGLGPMAGKVWRIGLMGETCRPENVERILSALREIM